jgi:hypothetical protein
MIGGTLDHRRVHSMMGSKLMEMNRKKPFGKAPKGFFG